MRKGMIILFLGLLLNMGCTDWVNVQPENSTTYTNFFKTEKDAASLLYSIETYLRALPVRFTEYGEMVERQFGEELECLPILLDTWSKEYYIIDAANLLIENAWRFPLSEDVLKPYLLQAYFAKAQAYFQLARDFGEAPIIIEGGLYEPRAKSSVREVLEEAEKWALMSIELPKYEDLKIGNVKICKQYGSKGAAVALLAHIYAWRAGVFGEEDYWSKAEEYCSMIINGEVGYYDLVTTPEEVCLDVLKGESREGIWEMYIDEKELETAYFYGITKSLFSFPVINTASPDEWLDYVVSKDQLNALYDVGDLRASAYFWHPEADSIYLKNVGGEVIADVERGDDIGIQAYGNNVRGHLYKFRYSHYSVVDWYPTPLFDGMNMNVIRCRLADIILLRAECRARQGKAEAVEDLNRIRKRAYGDDQHGWPNANDVEKGLDKDIRLAIFREREKEFLLEGCRYYDARRNGVDYVRRLLPAYNNLTDQEIEDGALYMGLADDIFSNNDLVRQNVYWNSRLQ